MRCSLMNATSRSLSSNVMTAHHDPPSAGDDGFTVDCDDAAMPETLMECIEREGRDFCALRPERTLIVGVTRQGVRDLRAFRSPGAVHAPVPDERTVYEIGSFSKVYTTALLSVLV